MISPNPKNIVVIASAGTSSCNSKISRSIEDNKRCASGLGVGVGEYC